MTITGYTKEIIRNAEQVKEAIDKEYWRAIKFNNQPKKEELERLYKKMGTKPDYEGYKDLGENKQL